MAAVSHCGRVVRFSQVLGFVQRHRSYHKKIRGRVKEQKPRKIDLDELLGGNTAESASSRTTNRTSFASPQNEAKSGGDWQHSQERLTLLRKGEKRVAAIAVLTMILALCAMKFMLPGTGKKEQQESEGS